MLEILIRSKVFLHLMIKKILEQQLDTQVEKNLQWRFIEGEICMGVIDKSLYKWSDGNNESNWTFTKFMAHIQTIGHNPWR